MRATALCLALAAAACGARDPAPGGATPSDPKPGAPAGEAPHGAAPCKTSDSDASIALFESRVAADARDDMSRAMLAALLLRRHAENGDAEAPRRAEKVARQALTLRPESTAGAAALARALCAQGRHEEAIAACRGAPGFDKGDLDLLCALADCAFDAGRIEDAAHAVELLVARDNGAATLLRAARLAREQGSLEKAVVVARLAAAAAKDAGALPMDAAAPLVEEGRAHLALGKFDEAAKNFDRALEVWPRCADAWIGRAGCDARRNRPAEALTAARRAAEIRCGVTERALVDFLAAPSTATAEASAERVR